ncbi:hypothetical protein HaLaN_22912 [Haematococcus lacustris]|uniref:Uncharacterized protein n=1 Tax=Haematococcus lacustris TaxID=44745 RepID=A0A6A0A443_HAELA|nr:hypothetical protein HaLaN_06788 [Haematococcus lacustris]GFH25022.1 hypothetical protein HaLaN_22912 [Haematococcus lacustris]
MARLSHCLRHAVYVGRLQASVTPIPILGSPYISARQTYIVTGDTVSEPRWDHSPECSSLTLCNLTHPLCKQTFDLLVYVARAWIARNADAKSTVAAHARKVMGDKERFTQFDTTDRRKLRSFTGRSGTSRPNQSAPSLTAHLLLGVIILTLSASLAAISWFIVLAMGKA